MGLCLRNWPEYWYSAEGLDWKPATVEAATDADADQNNPGEVLDVTAGGPGYVAVGSYFRTGGDGNTSMVWTSVDGLTWRRVAPDPVFERSSMASVVAWRGELLAFGCANISPTDCDEQLTETTWERHPRVWASSDGLSWRIIELSLPAGVVGVQYPIVSTDRLWGMELVGGSPTAWLTSTDGHAWARSDLPLIGPLRPLADDGSIRPSSPGHVRQRSSRPLRSLRGNRIQASTARPTRRPGRCGHGASRSSARTSSRSATR